MDGFLVAKQHKGLCGIGAQSGFRSLGTLASSPCRACLSPCKPRASLKAGDHSHLFLRHARSAPVPHVAFDSHNGFFATNGERGGEDEELSNSSLSTGCGKLVPLVRPSLLALSQEMAMGLVLPGAGGTGWTTGSGLEGPSGSATNEEGDWITEAAERRWPMLTKSPRRRMRVAFTCNVCGERTTRAINPHAYTDGTVFVQCKGCNVFHKLVDNLNLFHELKGHIFKDQCKPGLNRLEPYDILHSEEFPFF